jgi:HAD superfamily hydrolase (TIGR01484 family)
MKKKLLAKLFIFGALTATILGCCFNACDSKDKTSSRLFPRNATLKSGDGPLVQAHRGGLREYDDNAAGGFKWCLERGVRGFEVDIRLTKDGHLIVMHDSTVDRTTDGTGKAEDLTLEQYRNLKLNACSETVPTAEDIFNVFKGRDDFFIELEMKAYPGKFYTDEVLEEYCRKLNAAAKASLPDGTYAFTCFNTKTLATMRKVSSDAPLGLIIAGPLKEKHIAIAKQLNCCGVAANVYSSEKSMVERAHNEGLSVCLFMAQTKSDWDVAKEKRADRVTSDVPVLLTQAIAGKKKKLIAIDLDATLSQHRTKPPEENLNALKKLEKKYKCIMVGAGNAQRIYKQMGNYPIDIVANYGMQIAEASDGNFRIVKAVTNNVDRGFFTKECDYLRKKYGYTQYTGKSIEFHASGMVTFGLLGTSAQAEQKVSFDPDRKKRRAMYPEVLKIFKDYSCYIGGSTSFDFAGIEYNKYDATLKWANEHGFTLDEIVFIGDDFADGGGDSHVRIKGMDHIVITDYRAFPYAIKVLLD